MTKPKAVTPIRLAREKRGWSQLELCHKTGLSYNTVAFAERGGVCTPETSKILERVLGITVKVVSTRAERAERVAKKKAKKQVAPKRKEAREKEEREKQDEIDRVLKELKDFVGQGEDAQESVDAVIKAASEDLSHSVPEGHGSVGETAGERGEDNNGVQSTDGLPPTEGGLPQ